VPVLMQYLDIQNQVQLNVETPNGFHAGNSLTLVLGEVRST
jgi:hypothetical protein